ncbi:transcription factor domain protein [Aspergillus affinis]|uniref:transcription factor domain protein n=1 Tax=Aspergillus affinis TaxID=1070780 RepID=UPI0022FE55D7|nr:fungal-specific transcription factor domain protein [Aspergillus affinis]KAI9044844.1 fungal-specific transcription factor domain protein [Aspergillus affinis]
MPTQEQGGITVNTETDLAHHTEPNVTAEPWLTAPFMEASVEDHLPPLIYRLPERSPAQAIQSLDLLNGFSSQLIGASGESDPWLLRHGKFDDRGYMLFHQVHFRNAGGVPVEEKIPAHFLISANAVYESTKETTRFIKFVFPTLPILSRSLLGLSSSRTVPDQEILKSIPTHLLAAIYATAYQFIKFDDYLSVLNAYTTPPTLDLWRMVVELIMCDIHTSHLSTLQAGLLYLHRGLQGPENAIADSPFIWSFLGLLVGMATCLGLQLECRLMGLPAWEKRLRRRLWWALYAEDKWRSLLMGRPPYIRNDEWDVEDLDDDDFRLDGMPVELLLSASTENEHQRNALRAQVFRNFVNLAKIADDLQHSLFSLRAAQRLSTNFGETLKTAQVLLRRLKEWYSNLPPTLKLQNRAFPATDSTDHHLHQHTNPLHFAYILLEVFIFRSLLRPMVRSAAPPRLFEETDIQDVFTNPVDDYIAQIVDCDEVEPTPAIDMCSGDSSVNVTLTAAENCAARMIRFVVRMPLSEGGFEFWYSWCRIGFATTSNFMLLLLVQAPSADYATRAHKLLHMWRQTIRRQSQGNEWMKLALVRHNSQPYNQMQSTNSPSLMEIDPSRINVIREIKRSDASSLFEVALDGQKYVLKLFHDNGDPGYTEKGRDLNRFRCESNAYKNLLEAGAIEGMKEIHRAGVHHQDIYPKNLLVHGDSDRLVWIDFDVATTFAGFGHEQRSICDYEIALVKGFGDALVGTPSLPSSEALAYLLTDTERRPGRGPSTEYEVLLKLMASYASQNIRLRLCGYKGRLNSKGS